MRLPDSAYAFLQVLAKPRTKPQPKGRHPPTDDVEKRAVAYLDKCDPAVSGQAGHNKTFGVACRVGPGFDLSEAVALRLLRDHYNPRCEPPWSEGELQHKVTDAYRIATDRGWLLRAERNGRHAPSSNGAPRKATPPGRLIILASEVTPRKVEWLWPDRIPLGKLTTFAGWGGLGKSFVTMDLAARISNGDAIPGMGGECFEQGNVLILNTEDDPDDTSVPRLIEAGANLKRIAFAQSEVLGRFTLNDLDTLDTMLAQLGGARLLVIDPATAHLGPTNDNRNAELRALLVPLSLWAMEQKIAVVLVTHVNKPQAGKVEAMARVVGSVAWVNAVRAAVMFARDPEDRSLRLFIPFKSNNAPDPKGLSYRIVRTETLGKVEWIGEVETSADEAMSPIKKESRGALAVDWLEARFRERREWESDEIKELAKGAGISTYALWSPEVKALPFVRRKRGEAWWWIAEPGWPKALSESSESSESSVASPDATTDIEDSACDTKDRKLPESSFRLSEDSEHHGSGMLSESSLAEGLKLKARALRQLVGLLMGGPIPRDRAVVIAAEVEIPLSVLKEAAKELGIKSSVTDGQEIWSLP